MPDASKLRILGIFAHPDDETYCAGGTFAKYIEQGAEVMVISATKGQAGQIHDVRAATRRTLGEVRERELQLACARLGVQTALCWDYMDGTLKDADESQLIGDVVRAIRSFRPHIIITFDPTGAYGHPDHIAISIAVTRAYDLSGDPRQYPGQIAEGLQPHQAGRLYYSFFPNNRLLLLDQLVNWLTRQETRFKGSVDFLKGLSLFVEESTMLRYASDFVDVRWFPPGASIVEQGETANSLYVIVSGNVDVVQEQEDGALKTINRLSAGSFFGELALAEHTPRTAHVIAVDTVTCLIFSPGAPTAFTGRGAGANLTETLANNAAEEARASGATTCIDVTAFTDRKIAAVAAHRTQSPVEPDMFPREMLNELFGREYFVRVQTTLETELYGE